MQPGPINPNSSGARIGPTHSVRPASGADGATFKDTLKDYLGEVNALQDRADVAVRDLAVGRSDNVHQVIVAISEADLSFRLMMQMRNKLVEAYREIMRLQV